MFLRRLRQVRPRRVRRRMFRQAFYRRLSCIFGHIAHYDADGFWDVWFATPAKQRQFVQRIHEWVPVGDPHFCWVDVERELKSWAATEARGRRGGPGRERAEGRRGGAGRDRPPGRPPVTNPAAVHSCGEKQQFERIRA